MKIKKRGKEKKEEREILKLDCIIGGCLAAEVFKDFIQELKMVLSFNPFSPVYVVVVVFFNLSLSFLTVRVKKTMLL